MKLKIKTLKSKPKKIKVKEFLDAEYDLSKGSPQPESLGDKVGGFKKTLDNTVKASHQFDNNWSKMGVNPHPYYVYEDKIKEDKILFSIKVKDFYTPLSKEDKAKFKIKKVELKDGELVKKAIEDKGW